MTLIVKNNIPLPSGNVSEDIYFFIEFFFSIFFDGFSFIFTFILLAIFYILAFEIMRHCVSVDRICVYFISFPSDNYFYSLIIPALEHFWCSYSLWDYFPCKYFNLRVDSFVFVGLYIQLAQGTLFKGMSQEYIKNLSFRIGIFPLLHWSVFLLMEMKFLSGLFQ